MNNWNDWKDLKPTDVVQFRHVSFPKKEIYGVCQEVDCANQIVTIVRKEGISITLVFENLFKPDGTPKGISGCLFYLDQTWSRENYMANQVMLDLCCSDKTLRDFAKWYIEKFKK